MASLQRLSADRQIALGSATLSQLADNNHGAERCMTVSFFSIILGNACTSVIRNTRWRSQAMHVGIGKYQQATDSTRRPRPATPNHPRTGATTSASMNLAARALLRQATARIAMAGLQPSVTLHPRDRRTHAPKRPHHIPPYPALRPRVGWDFNFDSLHQMRS